MIMFLISPIEPAEGIIDLSAACMDRGDSVRVYRREFVRQRFERSVRLGATAHCPENCRKTAQSVVLVGLPLHRRERCGELTKVEPSHANRAVQTARSCGSFLGNG